MSQVNAVEAPEALIEAPETLIEAPETLIEAPETLIEAPETLIEAPEPLKAEIDSLDIESARCTRSRWHGWNSNRTNYSQASSLAKGRMGRLRSKTAATICAITEATINDTRLQSFRRSRNNALHLDRELGIGLELIFGT